MMKKQILVFLATFAVGLSFGQTPRAAFHDESFVFSHELNPAFQPENSYYSLPMFGNCSMYLNSSLKLSDLLYDTQRGEVTTFMSKGTITKEKMMDKVGDAWQQQFGGDVTLASWGFRIDENRYQTLAVSYHAEENLRLGKGYFDFLKDFQMGSYDLSDAKISFTSYLALEAGESRKLDEQWTVGAKAKLLLGMQDLRLKVHDMDVNLGEEKWTASGHVEMEAAGLKYRNEVKDYNSIENEGRTYQSVTGLKFGVFGGLGLAMDAGATYKYDDQWTFAASLLDFGFITWLGNHRAKNGGEPFEFSGFTDACLDEPDQYDNPEVYKPTQSIGNQIDNLKDDLMDLAHLSDCGNRVRMGMLGATVHLGATYKMDDRWTFGALATSRIQGTFSWAECRLTGKYHIMDRLEASLSPYIATNGWGTGAMIHYQLKSGHTLYVGSDHLVFKTNKQLIPMSLQGAISGGVTFPLQ